MKIGVAVLGCGYWGPKLLRNFAESPRYRVLACADSDPSRFERLAGQYQTVQFTTDYERILHDDAVDAVAIATPAHSHFAIARDALLNGKHVLVEKPLATSVAQAIELVRTAERTGRTLMVDHTFVYTGAVRKIRELINSGELGEIYYFDSVRVNLGLFRHDVDVLWDLAPHDLSIMSYVLPKQPIAVSASGQTHISPDVIDVAYLTVYFDNGIQAHFHCNWLAPVKIRTIIIGGSKRLVMFDDTEPSEKVRVYDRGIDVRTSAELYNMLIQYRAGDMYAPKLDATEALSAACEHFADCVATGRTPITGGEAGLSIVRILEAADQSIREDSRKIALDPAGVGLRDLVSGNGSRPLVAAGTEDARQARPQWGGRR